jgi:hypothetical protein
VLRGSTAHRKKKFESRSLIPLVTTSPAHRARVLPCTLATPPSCIPATRDKMAINGMRCAWRSTRSESCMRTHTHDGTRQVVDHREPVDPQTAQILSPISCPHSATRWGSSRHTCSLSLSLGHAIAIHHCRGTHCTIASACKNRGGLKLELVREGAQSPNLSSPTQQLWICPVCHSVCSHRIVSRSLACLARHSSRRVECRGTPRVPQRSLLVPAPHSLTSCTSFMPMR